MGHGLPGQVGVASSSPTEGLHVTSAAASGCRAGTDLCGLSLPFPISAQPLPAWRCPCGLPGLSLTQDDQGNAQSLLRDEKTKDSLHTQVISLKSKKWLITAIPTLLIHIWIFFFFSIPQLSLTYKMIDVYYVFFSFSVFFFMEANGTFQISL